MSFRLWKPISSDKNSQNLRRLVLFSARHLNASMLDSVPESSRDPADIFLKLRSGSAFGNIHRQTRVHDDVGKNLRVFYGPTSGA